MLEDKSYRNEDIYASIKELTKNKNINFKKEILQNTRIYYKDIIEGEWSPFNEFSNKEVLILAPGKSLDLHKISIQKFIKKYSPIVIALNILENIDDEYIDYRIASHPIRIFSDLQKYELFKHPLIIPKKQLLNYEKNPVNFKILDFGIRVKENFFEFGDKSCTIPSPLVMAYALAVINSGKAKHIYCVGFDGYKAGDPRQEEVNHIWESYFKCKNHIEVTSLTNTSYNIPRRSIYSYL